ncbi:hypothetical protein ACFX14_003111 [Malus domestica]
MTMSPRIGIIVTSLRPEIITTVVVAALCHSHARGTTVTVATSAGGAVRPYHVLLTLAEYPPPVGSHPTEMLALVQPPLIERR